ncbi:hypothetical protein M8J75_001654 [Diaphorina citri]|nr:hypothetical protein M8J75_001654 [Diaphorina citri]
MNDNTRTGKRTKSRTKELEENDDDEDDSERRKYTMPNVFEINGNIHEIDTQHNSSHGQHSDQVDNCRYNTGRTEHEGNVGNANTIPKDFSKANREISTTNEQMTTKPLDERHNVNINIESVDTNRIVDNSKQIRSNRSHGQCPNECEYWGTRGNIARDVKNSYWHCSEVESYERKQNRTPCTGNNINRMESSRENGFCEARETYRENPYCEQNCIYLPFENVTKDRSCFRKNCACHQKYLTKHMNLGESCNCSSKKKTELLLSPSSLSRSNDNYEECSCHLSNCCDKQSDYNTIHSQYRRTNKPSRTCGHREKRKSNHFKDKVNQVLPNVMASVVTKHRLPENQRRSCNETCLNSCDNCNQYNGSIVPEPNPVNSDSNRNNSLVPNGSLVPENRVPCQTVNSVCNSSNNLQPMSPNAETPDSMHVDNLFNDVDKENVKPIDPDGDHLVKRKETLSDVKEKDNHVSCSDEKFLDIKIKLNPDRLKEEGSASHTTCITESVSEQNSVESHLQSALIQPEIRVTESTTANESEPKGEILEVNKLLDVPTSSKYLTSPLRNNRRKSNREQRPKSIPERKIRKQFYTPYEEALSSLLWQPYDCRNNALANMEVSDMSDSEDQTKRNVHRTRRKSGLRSTKHDRQDHRLVGSTSMHSYVLGNTFDNPPEYGMMENFQSFAYDDFFSACNPSLLCRNCKINLFVEDDDEFRGKYFCFNCKELKRFLYESNPEDDLGRDRTHFEKRSYGSLDGACGMTYPDSVSSGILSSNQMIPQIYLKHNVRPKHHSKQKHVNELGKKPKHNQDNDTCSSTLSSSYSSTSSLSSLECSPPGAFLSSGLDRGGSGTQPAQFSAETCRVNVDQSLYFYSDTSLSSQTKISKPGSTYNVDSKMLVNISNSNHNLSLSQSNLLSNSQNNLISVVTNNPSVSASDNNHISNSQNNNGNSENLVNIVSCYRPVPVVTVSSSENNHVPSDNPTYTNSFNQFASSSGPYPHHGGESGQVKSVNRCVSSVSVPAGSSGLPPPPPPPQNGLPKPLPTTSGSRTFISTEAQTDEIILSRDQRRRERRERRQQRRLAQQLSQWPSQTPDAFPQDRLPDILHSHVPPPYSTLPLGVAPCSSSLPPSLSSPPSLLHPSLPNLPPASHCGSPIHPAPSHSSGGVTSFAGIRFPFTIVPTGRRR